jgi:hypothetical protein
MSPCAAAVTIATMADVRPNVEPPLEETPDLCGACPQLSEGQIEALRGRGQRRETHAGEVVHREGDRQYDFVVVLHGKVAVVEGYGSPDEQVVGVHGAGDTTCGNGSRMPRLRPSSCPTLSTRPRSTDGGRR